MEIILIFVLILIYVLMLALIACGLIIFNNMLILIYVLMLALIAGVPIVLDMHLAYKARKQLTEKLIEKASHNGLTIGELKELLKEIGKAPIGTKGIYRTTMALTVIMILGIAVFHVLIMDVSSDNLQILNNILSMLAGLLAAITGFYFGGRTAETAYQEKEEARDKPPKPP